MNHEGRPRRRWWLRPPAIAAALLLSLIPLAALVARMAGYKPFYIAAEAMEPTLRKNDRIIAWMHSPAELRRGDIILFQAPAGGTYIKRLAGLPGDRIALRAGVVILNGTPVAQRFERNEEARAEYRRGPVRLLAEQFPGEAGPHRIYDSGYDARVDDFPEQRVMPGHVFVLGDNRDMSADSRVPVAQRGVEQLPIERVRGIAKIHSFGSSKGIGDPI